MTHQHVNVVRGLCCEQGGEHLGFALSAPEDAESERHDAVRSLVLEELKAAFRPELLNRLDEVVVFRRLAEPQVCFTPPPDPRFGRLPPRVSLARPSAHSGPACPSSMSPPVRHFFPRSASGSQRPSHSSSG